MLLIPISRRREEITDGNPVPRRTVISVGGGRRGRLRRPAILTVGLAAMLPTTKFATAEMAEVLLPDWRPCQLTIGWLYVKSGYSGRVLLARAYGDENGYRDHRDRYRDVATSLGFEGHIAWAEEMP